MLSCGVCFFLSILYFAVLLYFVFSSTGCMQVGRESKNGGVEVACQCQTPPPSRTCSSHFVRQCKASPAAWCLFQSWCSVILPSADWVHIGCQADWYFFLFFFLNLRLARYYGCSSVCVCSWLELWIWLECGQFKLLFCSKLFCVVGFFWGWGVGGGGWSFPMGHSCRARMRVCKIEKPFDILVLIVCL